MKSLPVSIAPGSAAPPSRKPGEIDGSDPRAPGGQPAAGARRYSAPIPINAATKLTVRAFDPAAPSDPASGKIPVGSGWSAPTVLVYSL